MATHLIDNMRTTAHTVHNDLPDKVNKYLQTKAQDPDQALNPLLPVPEPTQSLDTLLETLQKSVEAAQKGDTTP